MGLLCHMLRKMAAEQQPQIKMPMPWKGGGLPSASSFDVASLQYGSPAQAEKNFRGAQSYQQQHPEMKWPDYSDQTVTQPVQAYVDKKKFGGAGEYDEDADKLRLSPELARLDPRETTSTWGHELFHRGQVQAQKGWTPDQRIAYNTDGRTDDPATVWDTPFERDASTMELRRAAPNQFIENPQQAEQYINSIKPGTPGFNALAPSMQDYSKRLWSNEQWRQEAIKRMPGLAYNQQNQQIAKTAQLRKIARLGALLNS